VLTKLNKINEYHEETKKIKKNIMTKLKNLTKVITKPVFKLYFYNYNFIIFCYYKKVTQIIHMFSIINNNDREKRFLNKALQNVFNHSKKPLKLLPNKLYQI